MRGGVNRARPQRALPRLGCPSSRGVPLFLAQRREGMVRPTPPERDGAGRHWFDVPPYIRHEGDEHQPHQRRQRTRKFSADEVPDRRAAHDQHQSGCGQGRQRRDHTRDTRGATPNRCPVPPPQGSGGTGQTSSQRPLHL